MLAIWTQPVRHRKLSDIFEEAGRATYIRLVAIWNVYSMLLLANIQSVRVYVVVASRLLTILLSSHVMAD